MKGHADDLFSVAWSSNGQILASGSADRKVQLWTRDGMGKGTLEVPGVGSTWFC